MIIAIVGESGSGKSLIADYISENYGISTIQSYTDRPKRFEEETGHQFITKTEYNKLNEKEMIAKTEINGFRYCCLEKDVTKNKTYIVDEPGLYYLRNNYDEKYDIKAIRVVRPKRLRIKDVGVERVMRNESHFNVLPVSYDFLIKNNGTFEDLFKKID